MRTHNKPCTKTSRLSTGTSERQYSCDQCRICLEDGEIPIFGENDISIDIAEFGQIKIEKDENLPMFICENCMSLLEGAILFRKTAKLSEEKLNKHRHEASLKSEDFGRKNEEENDIKTEYLEFDYSSDSNIEIADFECKKEFHNEDSTSQNHTISEEQESEDIKDFCIETDNFDESIVEKNEKEIDNEMIMIIVSDKDKPKLEKKGEQIDVDDGPESELSEQPTQKGNTKECEVCLEMVPHFKYEDHLQEHRKKYVDTCNKRNAKVECKHCGKCVSKTYIKLHMRILHGTPEEQAERQIKCELCDRSFNRNYYADHVKRVHGSTNKNIDQKQLKCIECPVCYKEIKESKYEAHVAWHGGRLKQLICDKCGKVFKHPSAFKTHCLTHGSELKYKCQFCPYRGLHQALLKIHVRTHTGDYNYKCTECPARFITKSNLSKHLQRHKAPSNFKCEVCGRCFYSKRDLDKHAKCVHMSLKTHVCDICGKGFGHRDNLLSHQLKTHKKDKTGRKGRMPSYLKVDLQNVEQC